MLLLALLVCLMVTFMTETTSNTASTTLLLNFIAAGVIALVCWGGLAP